MKIEIIRPNPGYPLVYVQVPHDIRQTDTERWAEDVHKAFADRRITLLGEWERVSVEGTVITVKAPALLEDEHVKPPKRRGKR